ncbi:hypothetical protein OG21DRAFT_1524837 [Imleria badia]|nr:hypothetical protein OG21DRAFT_1524837 [Imleria badia]
MPGEQDSPDPKVRTVAIVLLTGTTGGLGSFFLAQLLENPVVERVYASIAERQKSGFVDKALPVDILNSAKLAYMEVDASQDNCGLTSAVYDESSSTMPGGSTSICLSESSFESYVRATRNLVDLAFVSAHRETLRFLFTSSIGSAHSWDRSRGLCPEEVLLDPSFPVSAGYRESKYVSERITGRPNGSWATTDWFPILVKFSIALGALPDAHGTLPLPALNIVNPRGVPWTDVPASDLEEDAIPMVPFGDWFGLLEKHAEGACSEDIASVPAIKLLEYFRVMAQGDSDQSSQNINSVHRDMNGSPGEGVGEKEAQSWVRYWSKKVIL